MERKGRKLQPGSGKPTRPTHMRQQSYNKSVTTCQGSSSSRPILGARKKTETEVISLDEDETGMASFIQFCATCEKQIVTPGNNILYCSESCRRRDVSRSGPVEAMHSPSAIPTAASYFDMPASSIVPPRSPTVARPLSLTFSDLALSDTGSPPEYQYGYHDYSLDFSNRTTAATSKTRPHLKRAPASESGMPSLVNTPSSSVGTAGSTASYRPLPPRHDPLTGHFPHKSADLVIPTFQLSSPAQSLGRTSTTSSVSTITATRSPPTGDVAFDRRSSNDQQSKPVSGSLKQLFSHEAMRSGPSDVRHF